VNAVSHGVADRMQFLAADLLPPHLDQPYSVVCANLPYVATDDLAALDGELRFEPVLALDGGPDGLDVIRRLLALLPTSVRPDGVALLEIGADQAELTLGAVASILPGWRCEILPDLAGRARVARIAPARGA
jgi:release factor glutamine methyltransferase